MVTLFMLFVCGVGTLKRASVSAVKGTMARYGSFRFTGGVLVNSKLTCSRAADGEGCTGFCGPGTRCTSGTLFIRICGLDNDGGVRGYIVAFCGISFLSSFEGMKCGCYGSRNLSVRPFRRLCRTRGCTVKIGEDGENLLITAFFQCSRRIRFRRLSIVRGGMTSGCGRRAGRRDRAGAGRSESVICSVTRAPPRFMNKGSTLLGCVSRGAGCPGSTGGGRVRNEIIIRFIMGRSNSISGVRAGGILCGSLRRRTVEIVSSVPG